MDNLQNRRNNNPTPDLESDRNLNTNVKKVPPSPAAYTEGYVHGRASERSLERQHQEIRASNAASRGLLLGIALTSLVGLVAGSLFFLNQKEEPPIPEVVPSPVTSQQPVRETTIIERTTENTQQLPADNQQSPAATQEIQPDIRVNTPSSGQQQAPTQLNIPTQPNIRSQESVPTQPQNSTSPANPSATQQNTTPQAAPAPSPNQPSNTTSTTSQPDTTNNQIVPTQPQNEAPTDTSTRIQLNTANQASPAQTQNQTQPANSGSAQ